MSIVIRESVDVGDVLLELLEDRLEDESTVVMNNDLPLKFALTSLNFIFDPDSLLSLLEQEIMVKLRRDIRSMKWTPSQGQFLS